MDLVRPARVADLEALLELAALSGFGLTTLPRDPEFLRKRLTESERSFAHATEEPRGEPYLFVLERGSTHEVIGTSAILSKVGGFEPFYAYRVETKVHESKMLDVRKEIPVLHLVREHSGPSEIGGLFLAPQHRESGRGRLLSRARFLFMAEHPGTFDAEVLSEIRGVSDEHGVSPFWEAVGRKFFDIDFPKADYLSLLNKRFIADLMPTHPLYLPLLPAEACEVIGEPHAQSRGALKLLEEEGFQESGMVDIFDAGPIVRARVDELRTTRTSVRTTVAEIVAAEPEAPPALIARAGAKAEFRATAAPIAEVPGGGVRMSAHLARGLGVKEGDPVRFAPLDANRGARP